ncbi:subtilisin-like protein [Tilletiaria anomala UBC 951]|uniref:Subtilisin-like protein n=1 Tax=Tilletiaria anomala (strain ATCC 24038 / CBS 436.72 / UBC 951) TaxID=1037660 RepID=A0A066VFT7_TILAU|nr:subtilisin-like protein [Tilletiaria anomala UBC 951]KDN39168.1 subtilisin-like protein [Tilletiaria anomala UBC 951]
MLPGRDADIGDADAQQVAANFIRRARYRRSQQQDSTPSFYFSIRQEFQNEQLFFGLSVSLERASDAIMLAQMRGVKSVTPITFVRRPQPYANKVQLATKPSPKQISEHFSSLSACGVDKAHAEGINGTGIKVAVIDTGVDYTHPALGGCFGPTCKVSFGFDFVGDSYDGSNDPAPDSDPLSQCGPHGTHVSGIIGAQDKRYHLVGVAPGATLGMYRVFGCTGGTADDVLMKAMETAYEDGADIISISIGAPAGWTESPTAKVASQIAKKGRVVSVAAGNDGYAGMFFPSTPAVGSDVISVGSVDNAYYIVFNATISGASTGSVPYYSARPLLIPPLSLYATSFDTTVTSDACDPLPDYTPDLGKAIVLTKRGGCSLEQKFRNIAAYNGKYVIIYNTNIAPVYIEPANGILKSAMIGADDGKWLVDQLQQGLAVKMAFPDSPVLGVANTFTGGTVSSFSSYGPTFDMSSQTDLAAPGGSILGLWPVPLGNYSIVSGTSMAAPYIAGAAALLLQAAREGRTSLSESVMERFRSTAMPVFNATNSSRAFLETVAKQGAGLLQLNNAIHYTTHVFPSLLSLNDTSSMGKVQSFTIVNNGDSQMSYSITHEPAGTALTYPKNSPYPFAGPVPLVDAHASVSITPMTLSIDPGENQTIQVVFTPPSGPSPDPSTFPVFSGFIKVASSPLNESLTVAYLGLAAKMSSLKLLDTGNGVTKNYPLPAVLVGSTGKIQRLPRTYTFENGDVPVMQFRLVGGSRSVKVDLVETATQSVVDNVPLFASGSRNMLDTSMLAGTGLLAYAGKGGAYTLEPESTDHTFINFASESEPLGTRGTASNTIRPASSAGQVASSSFLPRNTMDPDYGIYALAWDGTVDGVGKVKPGDYQLHLKALRPGYDIPQDGGNSTSSTAAMDSDGSSPWEEWYSPIVRVR